MKHLILGGVKSGKSRYAEQLAKDWVGTGSRKVVYIATARAYDDEFGERIKRHQAQRPAHWETLEAPLGVAQILNQYSGMQCCVLLECLTLWLSNVLCDDLDLSSHIEQLCDAIERYEGELLIVSNETGMGIIPQNALARKFGDEAGVLHQRLATLCGRVSLTVAGLPFPLKTTSDNMTPAGSAD